MSRTVTAIGILVLWFFGPCLLGCNSGGRVPIDGQVKFADDSDVSPLAGYTVTMQREGESSIGEIQPDGSFTMTTLRENDGVLPGTHQITVTPPTSADPDKTPPKPAIPSKYFNFETSGLTADVQPGQGIVELTLDRVK
jgi:hypothetical protein